MTARRKKILFVSHEASLTGAPIFLIKLLQFISIEKPDYELAIIFSKGGELVDFLIDNGFNVFVSEKRRVGRPKMFVLLDRIFYYFFYIRIARQFRPDLVYSNTIVNFGEVILARLMGVPVIMHMHEGLDFSRACRHRLRMACFFVSRILVGSHYVNKVLYSLTGRTGIVVYNGVDIPEVEPAPRKLNGKYFTIGVLGTVLENKGQLVALKALRFLVERGVAVKLRIAGRVGNDGYYLMLRDFVQVNNLENSVEFVGSVPSVDEFLYSLNLLVVPSFDEAFPTVILEAFSTATFVIASKVGGIPEMIDDGISGLLFDPGDAERLADLIENLVFKVDVLKECPTVALKVLREKFDVVQTNRAIGIHLGEILGTATNFTPAT